MDELRSRQSQTPSCIGETGSAGDPIPTTAVIILAVTLVIAFALLLALDVFIISDIHHRFIRVQSLRFPALSEASDPAPSPSPSSSIALLAQTQEGEGAQDEERLEGNIKPCTHEPKTPQGQWRFIIAEVIVLLLPWVALIRFSGLRLPHFTKHTTRPDR